MAILLLVALGTILTAKPVGAESVVNISKSNSQSSFSTTANQSCNTDITINGQHYHSTDCNANISDKNGDVTTSPSPTPIKPSPPAAPSQPSDPAFPIVAPVAPPTPKRTALSDISTHTVQISQQISHFVQQLQQEITGFIHNLFHF
jgi:hypothetical protein